MAAASARIHRSSERHCSACAPIAPRSGAGELRYAAAAAAAAAAAPHRPPPDPPAVVGGGGASGRARAPASSNLALQTGHAVLRTAAVGSRSQRSRRVRSARVCRRHDFPPISFPGGTPRCAGRGVRTDRIALRLTRVRTSAPHRRRAGS
jgi:hypothetical protein